MQRDFAQQGIDARREAVFSTASGISMKKILIAAALAASSSLACAQGMYAGGTVGYTRSSLDCGDLNVSGVDCSTNSTGAKGFVGYRINNTFAVEASYFDLGKMEVDFSSGAGDLKSTGFGVRGLLSAPFSGGHDAFAYIALGINRVKSDGTISGGSFSASDSRNATKPSVAVGVDYSLAKKLDLRVEFEGTRFEDPFEDEYTVTNLSVGLKYNF